MISQSTAMRSPARPRSTAARARIRRGTLRLACSTTSPPPHIRALHASTMNSQAAIRGWRPYRIHARPSTPNIRIRFRPPCPPRRSCSFAPGTSFGGWQVSLFVDNLLNTHVTTNYERSFTDANNPNYPPPGPQYNYLHLQTPHHRHHRYIAPVALAILTNKNRIPGRRARR
jgi:hypothetical protein